MKQMEKETSEEVIATESSDKSMDDFDLGLCLEEILRKQKGKSLLLEQLSPSKQQPKQTPKPPTPQSTSTTPPPLKKPPNKKLMLSKKKEPTPPLQDEPIIFFSNNSIETGTLQDLTENPIAEKEETYEGTQTADIPVETATGDFAPGASASAEQATVVKTIIPYNIDETLNVVVTELATKKRAELGNTQKFFKKSTGADETVKEIQPQRGGDETVKEAVIGETTKEKQSGKATTEEEDSTLKDVAETLKDLTATVLEQPAELSKETPMQSGAQGASAPTPDKPSKTAALKTGATASKTPKGKQQKPKHSNKEQQQIEEWCQNTVNFKSFPTYAYYAFDTYATILSGLSHI